jgi:hypothetical protein
MATRIVHIIEMETIDAVTGLAEVFVASGAAVVETTKDRLKTGSTVRAEVIHLIDHATSITWDVWW